MAIEIELKGDKSLSHRYLFFEHLIGEKCELKNLSNCADVASTKECLSKIKNSGQTLNCGNSGTTLRLIPSLLSQMEGLWKLTGDESLMRRPMNRIFDPLTSFGAKVQYWEDHYLIEGSKLRCKDYKLPMASAQVKSCLLLTSLISGTPITLTGKIDSRDHTEIFLKESGINIDIDPNFISLNDSLKSLKPFSVDIPGDPSSAAFLIVARLFCAGEDLILKNILLNPTRVKFLEILKKMGAPLEVNNHKREWGELTGDLTVSYVGNKKLQNPKKIENISYLIDEIPILALAFSLSEGSVQIQNVSELKLKESNRIDELKLLFPGLVSKGKDIFIDSPPNLPISSHLSQDHRIFMTSEVLKFIRNKKLSQQHSEISSISFPDFFKFLNLLD